MTQESESSLDTDPDWVDGDADRGEAVREVRTGGSDVRVGGALRGAE
jgi:hypothetical protein